MTDIMATTYRCDITESDFSQKSHIIKHLKSKIYKTAVKKFREELEGMSKKDLKKTYKMDNIDDIIEALSCIKVKQPVILPESGEFSMSISNKEAMYDMIHSIHNFIRNNGGGYGMNALKCFNLLYGLCKIEIKWAF
jgi:hypothetical protein